MVYDERDSQVTISVQTQKRHRGDSASAPLLFFQGFFPQAGVPGIVIFDLLCLQAFSFLSYSLISTAFSMKFGIHTALLFLVLLVWTLLPHDQLMIQRDVGADDGNDKGRSDFIAERLVFKNNLPCEG